MGLRDIAAAALRKSAARSVSKLAPRVANNAIAKLLLPTRTWVAVPKLYDRVNLQRLEVDIIINPIYDRSDPASWYVWANFGTEGHVIKAKNAAALTIRGFDPKTIPGSLTSKQGGHFGVMAFRRSVFVWSDARNWTKIVASDIERNPKEYLR